MVSCGDEGHVMIPYPLHQDIPCHLPGLVVCERACQGHAAMHIPPHHVQGRVRVPL